MSSSNQTHNHQTIREWAESRGGVPASVIGTASNGDEGVSRINFPEFSKSRMPCLIWRFNLSLMGNKLDH